MFISIQTVRLSKNSAERTQHKCIGISRMTASIVSPNFGMHSVTRGAVEDRA